MQRTRMPRPPRLRVFWKSDRLVAAIAELSSSPSPGSNPQILVPGTGLSTRGQTLIAYLQFSTGLRGFIVRYLDVVG